MFDLCGFVDQHLTITLREEIASCFSGHSVLPSIKSLLDQTSGLNTHYRLPSQAVGAAQKRGDQERINDYESNSEDLG